MKVVTIVRGEVPQARRKEFESAYRPVKTEILPEGLETSFLMRKSDGSGVYIIETIWKSMQELQAMRSKEKPKAVALFEGVGVSPTVEVHEVIDTVP